MTTQTTTDGALNTRLARTAATLSARSGHELGEWRRGDWRGQWRAACLHCEDEAETHDSGHDRGYRALTEPCTRKTHAERRAEADAANLAAYRARFEWSWLRAGDELPGGHRLGADLEVRCWRSDAITRFDGSVLTPGAYHVAVEVPDVYYRLGGSKGSPAAVQGNGPTFDDALANLRSHLVERLTMADRAARNAQALADHWRTFVVPPT